MSLRNQVQLCQAIRFEKTTGYIVSGGLGNAILPEPCATPNLATYVASQDVAGGQGMMGPAPVPVRRLTRGMLSHLPRTCGR